MALNNNRDLRITALNVERAKALYGIQSSELFPTLDAIGAAVNNVLPLIFQRQEVLI